MKNIEENINSDNSLELGKSFDRSYNLKIRFLDGSYNISIFFDKKSPLVLFKAVPDFFKYSRCLNQTTNISMYKSLEGSKFCETFLELNTYRNNNLDIKGQYHKIKYKYLDSVNLIINETINLKKLILKERSIFDSLKIFGMTITTYSNEFFFLIAERQKVSRNLNKKIVRSSGLQIATPAALEVLDEFSNSFNSDYFKKDLYKVGNNFQSINKNLHFSKNSSKEINFTELDKKSKEEFNSGK